MSYDHRTLTDLTIAELARNPSVSLATVATLLGVERHTVTRALHATIGRSFRALRRESRVRRVEELAGSSPDMTIKQVAYEVGYQWPGSLTRFTRRLRNGSAKTRIAVSLESPSPAKAVE